MADQPQPSGNQRFVITAKFKDPQLETFKNELLDGISGLKTPISVGPNDALPTGIQPGQLIADWSNGTSITWRVWDGQTFLS